MSIKIIVSVIITKDDKILMVEEGKEYKEGLWNFPTGVLKLGEKITEAAVRKAIGEAGYDIKLTGFLKLYNYFVDVEKGWHILKIVLGGEPIKEEHTVESGEVKKAKWMTYDEIEALFEQGGIWSHNMMKDSLEVMKRRGFYNIDEFLNDNLFLEQQGIEDKN